MALALPVWVGVSVALGDCERVPVGVVDTLGVALPDAVPLRDCVCVGDPPWLGERVTLGELVAEGVSVPDVDSEGVTEGL